LLHVTEHFRSKMCQVHDTDTCCYIQLLYYIIF
jgi:hypothetical protein